LLSADAGVGEVPLDWTATGGTYTVLRATTSGDETTLASGLTTLSYVDATVTPGTTYYYTIEATNDAGTSPQSNELSVTPS